MTIQLISAMYISGSLAAAGSQHTLAESIEAGFIERGLATRVGSAPSQGNSPLATWRIVNGVPVLVDPVSGAPIYLKKQYADSYEQSPGTALFALSTTTPPAPTGATGSAARDATVQWDGGDTWKVINETVGGNIAVSYNLATPFVAPRVAPTLFIPVYIPDYKSLNDIQIYLSMGDTAYTNVFQLHTGDPALMASYGIGPAGHTDKQRNGWHLLCISPSDWSVSAGSPVWTSTINSIRIRFYKNATGGNHGIAYFGTPFMHVQSVAQLLLYADDVHRSFYNNGLPLADALGLKFNLACAVGWVNNSTYMNQAMYLDAQSRGHEICVHSLNQIGVNVLTYADAIADVTSNQAYVRDVIGARFGYKHFVWPNGRYWPDGADRSDMSVPNYLRDSLGVVLGRMTDDPARNTSKTTIGMTRDATKHNQLLLPETFPNNAAHTVAQFQAAIDDLIARKGVGTFVNHHVGYNGTADEMMPWALQQMLEYVAQKVAQGVLRCPTGEEFIDYL